MIIGLVPVIVRAELRIRRLAFVAVLAGAVTAAASIADDPDGPYALITDGVLGLRFSGVLLMLTAALIQSRPADAGITRELFLCGVDPRRARGAGLIAAVLATLAVWIASCTWAAVIGAIWTGGVSVGDSGDSVATTAAIGVGAVVLFATVGSAAGVCAPQPTGAAVLVASLAVVPMLLAIFGQYPPSLTLKGFFPTETVRAMVERLDGIRGTTGYRWGIPLAWETGTLAVLAGARYRDVVRARAAAPARSQTVLPAAAFVAALLALGVVVPKRIAAEIPWWLTGQWLGDLAAGRASEPVARSYASAVLAGDREGERALLAPGGLPIDPQLRLEVERAGSISSLRYSYTEISRPGTVVVDFSRTDDFALTVCARRTSLGWRVQSTTSFGTC